ncbi:MAG: hypothetical protein M1383_03870 [Patescibacteria group bacterium]|nr:hypothetical protein [Patescibacteria group bacterium]
MGEQKKFHLKVPDAVLASLKPTGCRASPESEAAWRLAAAIVVARELAGTGILPILKDAEAEDQPSPAEMHIPLSEDDINFLTEISELEGGSRGKLVRQFLFTAQKAVEEFPAVLTRKGLEAQIRKMFAGISAF